MKTYFILSDDLKYVKIGKSINPEKRLKQLQTSHFGTLLLFFTIDCDIEKELHLQFKKSHVKNEWFKFTSDIKHYIGVTREEVKANSFIPPKKIKKSKIVHKLIKRKKV